MVPRDCTLNRGFGRVLKAALNSSGPAITNHLSVTWPELSINTVAGSQVGLRLSRPEDLVLILTFSTSLIKDGYNDPLGSIIYGISVRERKIFCLKSCRDGFDCVLSTARCQDLEYTGDDARMANRLHDCCPPFIDITSLTEHVPKPRKVIL